MTSPSTHALTTRSSSPSPAELQELETWRGALDDKELGFWRSLSVAGELFMLEQGQRWGRRLLIGWGALSALIFFVGLWFNQDPINALDLLNMFAFGAFLSCFMSICSVGIISAPLMLWMARGLRRPPLLEELPERRLALELIQRRQHRAPLGLRRAIAQSFGPGIVITVSLVTSTISLIMLILTLFSDRGLTSLLSVAGIGVIFFSISFVLVLIPLGGAGLVAWSGKRVLDRRRVIRAQLESPDHVVPGALTQAQLSSETLQGGLSSIEHAGALSLEDNPRTLAPATQQDLNDDPADHLA